MVSSNLVDEKISQHKFGQSRHDAGLLQRYSWQQASLPNPSLHTDVPMFCVCFPDMCCRFTLEYVVVPEIHFWQPCEFSQLAAVVDVALVNRRTCSTWCKHGTLRFFILPGVQDFFDFRLTIHARISETTHSLSSKSHLVWPFARLGLCDLAAEMGSFDVEQTDPLLLWRQGHQQLRCNWWWRLRSSWR